MAWMKKQFLVLAIVAVVFCFSGGSPVLGNDYVQNSMDYELEAIVASAAITGTILSESAPGKGLLHSAGCYVWQQPGVALSIASIWQDGPAVELYFNADKFHSFLTAIPDYTKGEPFLHPP